MSISLQDRQDIADLMIGWVHRDLYQWDKLRGLFHPDGTIKISWFDGLFSLFVDASEKMANSDLSSKHLICAPSVTFNGDKAIAETSAMIVLENTKLKLGCNCYNRFYDLVEKRDGTWKIFRRETIYDLATFTFPLGMVEIDAEIVAKYPREYAPMAYILEKGGFPAQGLFATRGSVLETEMKIKGEAWLNA
jgi:hypothetical protein